MPPGLHRILTWYYRQYRASDFKIGGNTFDQYRWNWFWTRFTVVYPWLAGMAAYHLSKPLIPLFNLPRDFNSLMGVVVGFAIVLYLFACWILTAIKGPDWAYPPKARK